jgi:hypothetical protein
MATLQMNSQPPNLVHLNKLSTAPQHTVDSGENGDLRDGKVYWIIVRGCLLRSEVAPRVRTHGIDLISDSIFRLP